jgi:predicted transcriptional regulator
VKGSGSFKISYQHEWIVTRGGDHLERDPMLDVKLKDLMIPQEKVAHVQVGNPLEHALLVLVKAGYSAIPVLDSNFRLQGIISKTIILDSILGLEIIEVEKLSTMKVEEIMNTNIPKLQGQDDFIKALGLSINHPFVCIENEEKVFVGILPRSSILKWITKNMNTKM